MITIVDEREERIAEKHGSTGRFIYKEAVKRFLEGEIELEEMMDRVMEFARGNWTLMVDENRYGGLTQALVDIGYNANEIRPSGISDAKIKQRYKEGREKGIVVTADRSDFSIADVPEVFHRGLILLPGVGQPDQQAKAIENVLMHWRDTHGGKPVKVRLTRKDVLSQ